MQEVKKLCSNLIPSSKSLHSCTIAARIARCCSVVEELYASLSSARFEVGGCLLWWNNSKPLILKLAYHGAQESKVGEEEA